VSPDGRRLTIVRPQLTDAGKWTCVATNEAGSSELDLLLRVLVPPQIDRSNLVKNPLVLVFYLQKIVKNY
jgi:hemicentin